MAAIVVFTSCSGDDDEEPNIIIIDDGGGSGGGTDASVYTSRIEVPALAASDGVFVAHEASNGSKKVMNFCLEFSPSAMHSRWVAFRFDGITRMVHVGRSDEPFADDPVLSSSYWIGRDSFYGYDRGHICASADRLWSEEANVQTFYMSNISPQLRNFNTGIWADFENKMRGKCRDVTFADTVYVVKGGTVSSGMTKSTIVRNNKPVRVPGYYFMAFLRHRYGSYDAIGVWLEHKEYTDDERTLSSYLVSIDELEGKTGIDFFHNLPDATENAVEATFNKTLWGF